ncbi:Trm112 family protein [Corynebacterium heidelbergense]|uniref:UPF0434 protein DLJ54_03670 n=1 Tax=Corynebacterium heidelbergense TaxID=2055947 RepID=A0A364V6R7_9CORY|nr:Trm112 family protein [Corynebacterium heidelbergense]RAV32345.1 tetraacyldisaccharide 4'-kinase [Corynebacterium heidelbergense]
MVGGENAVDEKLLELVVCPRDKGPLERLGDSLVNPRLAVAYPVRDGIPVLLPDAATPWTPER